jgi:hypothetical protein
MRYGFILLDNVYNVNSFDKTENLNIINGNLTTIYFRLVTIKGNSGDIDHDTLRFIPAAGTQAYVSFASIDDAAAITDRPASQPYPTQDTSIFSVTLAADESIAQNSMSVKFNDGVNTFYAERLSDITQQDINSKDRFFC